MIYEEETFNERDENLIIEKLKQPKDIEARIIFIEGVDRTGKTTLQSYLKTYYKFRHLVVVRGPIGLMVYNEIYDRQVDKYFYQKMIESISILKPIIIYLYAKEETIKERILEEGGELIDINKNQLIYEKYINQTDIKVIKIDTDKYSLSDVANIATNRINIEINNDYLTEYYEKI